MPDKLHYGDKMSKYLCSDLSTYRFVFYACVVLALFFGANAVGVYIKQIKPRLEKCDN